MAHEKLLFEAIRDKKSTQKIIELLEQHLEIDVNLTYYGKAPIQRLYDLYREDPSSQALETLKFLISREGTNVNVEDRRGQTIAHYAAKDDDVEILRLIESKANFSIQDQDDETPFDKVVNKLEDKRSPTAKLVIASIADNIKPDTSAASLLSPHKVEPTFLRVASPAVERVSVNGVQTREVALQDAITFQKSWKYPLYNELANEQFQGGKYVECVRSIQEAVRLIEHGDKTTKIKEKASVYYNASRYLVDGLQDQEPDKYLPKALSYVKSAIKMFGEIDDTDNLRLSLLHEGFIHATIAQAAPVSDEHFELAQNCYRKAIDLGIEDFVDKFTTGGTAKELILFAVAHQMSELLDKVLELKLTSHKYGSKIDADIICDADEHSILEISVSLKDQQIIHTLLRLGANPSFNKGDALIKALIDKEWEIFKTLSAVCPTGFDIEAFIKEATGRYSSIDFEEIKSNLQGIFAVTTLAAKLAQRDATCEKRNAPSVPLIPMYF